MKYAIEFQEKAVVVYDTEEQETCAVIRYPRLSAEIELPISYTVTSKDDTLLGKIDSYLPQRQRIIMRNGEDRSTLRIGGNEELILTFNDTRYDIEKSDLDDLVDEDRIEQCQDSGFQQGYRFRSSDDVGG